MKSSLNSFDLSALILPLSIPQEEIQLIRQKYTVDGKRGLNPHISLVYPFVRNHLTYAQFQQLFRCIFNNKPPITVTFTAIEMDIDKGLIYLKPSPNPDIDELVTTCYQLLQQDIPPLFPHLTLAKTRNPEKLLAIAKECHYAMNTLLPFTITFSHAMFCAESNGVWHIYDTLPFSTETSADSPY